MSGHPAISCFPHSPGRPRQRPPVRLWLTTGLALCLLALAPWSNADSSRVELDRDSDPGTPIDNETDTPAPPYDSVLERIELYQDLLADLRSRMGNDDLSLLEPLNALSEAYISTGNYREAENHLNQQVQLQRMAMGLYTADQIPALESLLTLHALRRDWTELSNSLAHLGWLYSRTDMPTEARLSGMRELRGWQLLLLSQDIRERESLHILAHQALTEQAWEAALAAYGADNEALMPWLYDLSNSDLMLALTIMTNPLTGQDIIARTEGIHEQGLRPGQSVSSIADLESAYGARVNTVYERSFRSHMHRQFQRLGEIREFYAENNNPEAEAIVLIHLGDSVLVRQQFEERPSAAAGPRRGRAATGTAVRYYGEAYELFNAAGFDEPTLARYFGCPRLLPIDTLVVSLEQLPECPLRGDDEYLELPDAKLLGRTIPGISAKSMMDVVPVNMDAMNEALLQFNVARNGHATGTRALDTEKGGDSSILHSARRLMGDVQFRPALQEGSPVVTEQVRMHLYLP